MALVVTQSPQLYTPAHNNQWFTATSTNTAQPNHSFTVVITDLITTQSLVYQINPDSNGNMVFDAMPFSRLRVKNYIPLASYSTTGLYGFQQCLEAVRKIKVNVGETYGTTPVYYPGTDVEYFVWNAAIDRSSFATYQMADYLYDITVPRRRFFAGILSDVAYTDKSSFIYCLSKGAGDFTGIRVRTYSGGLSGAIVGSSTIANPFAASSNYREKYVCIDVGQKGLTNIASGLVTGTYPIITPSVDAYEISDITGGVFTVIKTFTMGCENRFEVKTVHSLVRDGSFGTCNFNLISNRRMEVESETFYQNPNEFLAGTYGYVRESAVERVLDVDTQDVLTLRTNYLSDIQIETYAQHASSPLCYLDTGSQRYEPLIRVPGTYAKLPHYEKKLVALQCDYRFAYRDSVQMP